MTKKVEPKISQEEIDRQLGELGIKVELEDESSQMEVESVPPSVSAPVTRELSGAGPDLQVETPKSEGPKPEPASDSLRAVSRPNFTKPRSAREDGIKSRQTRARDQIVKDEGEESAPESPKFHFNLWILVKLFVVILCLKSWWILVMWGAAFFFKDWSYLGVLRIQPYLIPNLLGIWYLAWKARRTLVRKIGEASSLGESTERHDVIMRVLAIPYFQCPVSIVFAVTGLNPLCSKYFGVIAAILLNLILGVGLRYYLPRKFSALNPD